MPVLSMDKDMRRSDSSGTDDDLPPAHRGHARGRAVGNGKAAPAQAQTVVQGGSSRNIDQLIRILEQDAYTSVLRAFGAQSEHITWAKERLISDLRKELRVTDEQHREFLAKVARDDSLRQIRDWRECGGNGAAAAPASNSVGGSAVPPLVPLARKKQKTGAVSQAAMPPPAAPPPQPPPPPASSKPVLASKKNGAAAAAAAGVPRGKSKGSSDRNGRGPAAVKREPSPLQGKKKDGQSETQDRWVGQTIKMRWPADNNFYEAYVKDYHKEDGTHTLVYDMGTENETSERVNLSTMTPEDIQCNGALERKQSAKKAHQGLKKRDKPGNPHTYTRADRKPSSKLPSVDTLAKQVEALEQDADLSKIEHAKRMAKEHEESIRKALLEVGESSDEEESDGGARQRDGYSRSMIVNSDEDKDRRQHQR